MGVYGLWRLIDSTGKPVPLQTLEGKVLAIDISIWIHQVLQGYQDRHGNPRPNAHLLGLFHRICKLLCYKIKPVFVFDGGVPILKKNTIASRRKQKSIATSKAQKMKTDLINNLIKHAVVKTVLNKENVDETTAGPSQINIKSKAPERDMFELPDMPSTSDVQSYISDESDSDSSIQSPNSRKQSKWAGNIHSVDVSTAEFKALPADVRYDILTDLKETRKQNSWGRMHEMPQESHDFSSFQMKRLLKRRLVQESLESAEKEMGGKTLTLEELEKLLEEQGINTKRDDVYRIAADSLTRLIYISDKNALQANNGNESLDSIESTDNEREKIEPVAGPSKERVSIIEDINEYAFDDDWDSDAELRSTSSLTVEDVKYDSDSSLESNMELNESRPLAKKYFGKNTMNPALTYMLEYSGLTQKQIMDLIKQNKKENAKTVSTEINTSNYTSNVKKYISDTKNIEKRNTEDNGNTDIQDDKCSRPATDFKKPESASKECMAPQEITEQQSVEMVTNEVTAKKSPTYISLKSDSESDDLVEVANTIDKNVILNSSNTTISTNKKSSVEIKNEKISQSITTITNMVKTDTSESDTDDFIEIKDVVPDINCSKSFKRNSFQITIQSDQKPEDDMFADIFAESKVRLPINVSEYDSQKNESADNSKSEVSNSRDNDYSTDISEKTVNQVEKGIMSEDLKKEEDSLKNIEINLDKSQEDNKQKETSNDKDIQLEQVSDLSVVNKSAILPVDTDELISLKTHLEEEQKELSGNIGKLERQAIDVSDQIRSDAQELLKLFGIPYIVAPMEAEAQCAYLEAINLTNGTITDDSDIWLFGGQCVYKHFFSNNKEVLRFQSSDIQHHFKLTRKQLIQLALLVGSDYTSGVTGIGPVTALEIIASFPSESEDLLDGLINFSKWINCGRVAGPGRTALRNKLRNIKIDKGFPNQAVVQAYLFPTVDESKETLTWGKPNVVLLADYTRRKFGWTKNKFEEQMTPVLKRIADANTQKGIDSYFKVHVSPKSIEANLSKRVQNAVRKMNNAGKSSSDTDDTKKTGTRTKTSIRRTKRQKNEDKKDKLEDISEDKNEDNVESKNDDKLEDILVKNVKSDLIEGGRIIAGSSINNKLVNEYIPQREKDKANSLKKKLHAIEVFRKSKQGLSKTKRVKRTARKIVKEAALSESSSDSS